MRQTLILLSSLLMILSFATANADNDTKPNWSAYSGAWFQIEYPPGFNARRSLDDSAFFISPDNKVEFYVFSPQWKGEPTDFMLNSKTEKVVAHKEVETPKSKQAPWVTTTRWFTVKAKNGSYWRSWVDTENTGGLNTRKVLGIKYRDQKAYNQYKSRYIRFKNSLIQYAD